eukprot:3525822-Rhodomonas_salina.1
MSGSVSTSNAAPRISATHSPRASTHSPRANTGAKQCWGRRMRAVERAGGEGGACLGSRGNARCRYHPEGKRKSEG